MWRRCKETEFFHRFFHYLFFEEHRYNRGYAVQVKVMLFDHWNCGCYRARVPIEIMYFRAHDSQEDGEFPTSYLRECQLLQELEDHLVSNRIGWYSKPLKVDYGWLE